MSYVLKTIGSIHPLGQKKVLLFPEIGKEKKTQTHTQNKKQKKLRKNKEEKRKPKKNKEEKEKENVVLMNSIYGKSNEIRQ